MTIPDWWEFALLGLGAWRLFHLLAYDDILNRPRRYLTGLPRHWKEDERIPDSYRERVAEFIECSYCLGFWTALGVWGAWQIWPHAALVAASAFALSAVLAATQRLLSSS